MGRKRVGCKKCGSMAARAAGHKVCNPCRVAKREAKIDVLRGKQLLYSGLRNDFEKLAEADKPKRTREEILAARREEYRRRSAEYKSRGLNWKGNPIGIGWSNSLAGLTPLDTNPVLDPDYEFGSESRLSVDDLKWLL